MQENEFERCKLCNRELTDSAAIERGVGPECYENFARNILFTCSWTLSRDDASELLEHHGYDIVVHPQLDLEVAESPQQGSIYFTTEHPPYFHRLPLTGRFASANRRTEAYEELEIPAEALLALANMLGLVAHPDIGEDGVEPFTQDSFDNDLCRLHRISRDPNWAILFHGSPALNNLRFSSDAARAIGDEIANEITDELWRPTYYGFHPGQRGWDLYKCIENAFGALIASEFEGMFMDAEKAAWEDREIYLPKGDNIPHSLKMHFKLDASSMVEGGFFGVYGDDLERLHEGEAIVNDATNPVAGCYEIINALIATDKLTPAQVEETIAAVINECEAASYYMDQADWHIPHLLPGDIVRCLIDILNCYAADESSRLQTLYDSDD